VSKWWMWRMIWLALGLVSGAIVFIPESAKTQTGIVAGIFILAVLVLLARLALLKILEWVQSYSEKPASDKVTLASKEFFPGASLNFEATKVGASNTAASDSQTELSGFRFAGYNFRTVLDTTPEEISPRKKALLWDTVLFAGGMLACAGLFSLIQP
jgi:hypothetical protein